VVLDRLRQRWNRHPDREKWPVLKVGVSVAEGTVFLAMSQGTRRQVLALHYVRAAAGCCHD
jgi:hypothetical protein